MSTPAISHGVWTIVVAAGGGTRFGSPKQYEPMSGRRVLEWSLGVARAASEGVVVVLPESDVASGVPGADAVVAGGTTRAESVRAGLSAVPADAEVVLVHDAARPAASRELFARVIAAVRAGADGVVPAVPVTDSLRARTGGPVDREGLVAVQTPQGFPAGWLRRAHEACGEATDDATLVELAGGTITIVDGETTNLKLTHPADRAALEATLAARARQP